MAIFTYLGAKSLTGGGTSAGRRSGQLAEQGY
jgi:hypothetical protein